MRLIYTEVYYLIIYNVGNNENINNIQLKPHKKAPPYL